MRLPSALMLLAGLLVLVQPTSSQALSNIGSYLEPWSLYPDFGPMAMTDNGEWIAVVESHGDGCSGMTFEQISMMRSDGTDHRVLVDSPALEALEPSFETQVYDLILSGNGESLVFRWPHKVDFCLEFGPEHWYRVDVKTGAVNEITFNGEVVGGVSLTDDGQTMAFQGYDPLTDNWDFYVANVDGTGAVKFLDRSAWYATYGKISGDGSKFVFYASNLGVCPCPAELLVYDFASDSLTTITPQPVPSGIGGFDISDDGQRVIYAGGPIYGVNSDGSDHHMIAPTGGSSATITGNGARVLYSSSSPDSSSFRVPWGGGAIVKAALFQGTPGKVATDDTGSLIAGWNVGSGKIQDPLAVWFDLPAVLTTYGHGLPGTELAWDIGGTSGQPCMLAFAWAPASIPLKTYGVLGLDPASLQVLAAGTIGAPDNIHHVVVALPPSLAVPTPATIYFQALVLDPMGHGARLTNTTAFALPATSGATAGGWPGRVGSPWLRHPASAVQPSPPASRSPAEAELRLRLQDPACWRAEQRAGRATGVPLR